MNKKRVFILLLAEFILLLFLHMPAVSGGETVLTAISFPFSLIGFVTGKLAATGIAGNAFAVMLTAIICLLPILYILKNIHSKEQRAEQATLFAFSVLSAIVLPCLADPCRLYACLPLYTQDMLTTAQTGLCLALWSALVCFAVLRLLRLFRKADKPQLVQYMRRMLYALCALFTACIAVSCVGTMLTQVRSAQNSADTWLAVLLFATNALPYFLDIAITFAVLDVLHAYSAETPLLVQKAENMSRICCIALALISTSNVIVNTVHILLINRLSAFSVSLNIPFVSLGFVLAILLCARLLIKNRRLSDDNELFV